MKNGSKEFFLAIFFGLHLEELRDFICQGLYLVFMVAIGGIQGFLYDGDLCL